MRKLIILLFLLGAAGCAKLSVETAKPIKVDISMRLDIYQHVAKDVESINDQIYGKADKQMNYIFGLKEVYAAEDSGGLELAVKRMRDRVSTVEEYLSKGHIGENSNALLEIVDKNLSPEMRGSIEKLISQENQDRKVIYEYTAQKNGADIKQVEKVFFQDHYKRAPVGSWFEVYSEKSGKYEWVRKSN